MSQCEGIGQIASAAMKTSLLLETTHWDCPMLAVLVSSWLRELGCVLGKAHAHCLGKDVDERKREGGGGRERERERGIEAGVLGDR